MPRSFKKSSKRKKSSSSENVVDKSNVMQEHVDSEPLQKKRAPPVEESPAIDETPQEFEERCRQRKVVVVLENAALETVKTKKGFQLLQADDHKSILQKHKRDPSIYRADIVHQVLLALLDSPLNKAGHLQVYICTRSNVLIEVNPEIRLPRTFKRFCGLMVQLLHKLSIRAVNGNKKLLKVIKNPVTAHLPVGAIRIGTSVTGELVKIDEFAHTLPPDKPIVFMFGAHAHGKCEVDWAERYISISRYPLSASTAINRVLGSFEKLWNVQ